jgi:hypothetical protein
MIAGPVPERGSTPVTQGATTLAVRTVRTTHSHLRAQELQPADHAAANFLSPLPPRLVPLMWHGPLQEPKRAKEGGKERAKAKERERPKHSLNGDCQTELCGRKQGYAISSINVQDTDAPSSMVQIPMPLKLPMMGPLTQSCQQCPLPLQRDRVTTALRLRDVGDQEVEGAPTVIATDVIVVDVTVEVGGAPGGEKFLRRHPACP